MKPNSYLFVYVLLLAVLACGFPSVAFPEPTAISLPPTPNLPFSASPAPQNPAGGNPPAVTPQFSNTIREEFDGKLSPGIGWTWLRQDNANWSLAAAPGKLRINLSTSGYLTGLPSNILTTAAPAGDFDIRTLVRFAPTVNFETAGLIVIFEERSVLQLGRAYCDLGSCIGSGYYFDHLQNGSPVGGNFGTTGSSGESVLRLVRQGYLYTAYYQVDGVNWIQLGSHTVDRAPLSIGLIAAQAPSAGAYAEFDWFEISQP